MEVYYTVTMSYPDGHLEEIEEVFEQLSAMAKFLDSSAKLLNDEMKLLPVSIPGEKIIELHGVCRTKDAERLYTFMRFFIKTFNSITHSTAS